LLKLYPKLLSTTVCVTIAVIIWIIQTTCVFGRKNEDVWIAEGSSMISF